MGSVNDKIFDHIVDHSIELQGYSNTAVRKMIGILNQSEASLIRALESALERLPRESFTVQRLELMLSDVQLLNQQAYAKISQEMDQEMLDLVGYEAEFQGQLFKNVLPVNLQVNSVPVEAVYAAAHAKPFQVSKNGAINLSDYIKDLSENRAALMRDSIKLGYVNGETIDQMVKTIRGTKSKRFEDGLLQAPRHHVEGMVRTAVNHFSNFTAQRFYQANDTLLNGVVWVSTLDSRTSPVCRARDQKIYPVDSGPRPPAHFGCRSRTAPVTKSWRQLGIDMDELSPSTRASMDGQVPQSTTYQKFLEGKSASRQDEILGPTRGKLFRAGMTVERFVDNKGRELTIAQLKARDAELFKKAGL